MKKANQEKRPSVLLYVIIIGAILIAVMVTAWHSTRSFHETTRLATGQFNHQQLILARSAAAGIDTFIADMDDDLLALSNFPAVQSMEAGILEQMEILFLGFPPQTSSRRLDDNGILRFIYPNEGWRADLIGQDYSHEAYFQEVKDNGEVVISGLIINEAGEARIQVVRPLYIENDEGGRTFNGIIISSFDPDMLASLYISPIVSGETGYAWLLNEEGIILAHYENEFVGQDAFEVRAETNPQFSYEAINDIQRQMIAGEEGVGRYVSGWHRGQSGEIEKLVAYAPVQVGNHIWSVAVCAPVEEVERITSAAHRNELYSLGFITLTLTAAGVSFFFAFHRWTRSLQQEIQIRTQAEARIVHLNAVLLAIRNVNHLIIRVKDRQELLQGACDNLIETRGYHSAWISLVKGGGGVVSAAQAGAGEDFPSMSAKLEAGELTYCIQRADEQSGVIMVANPAAECGDCPLAELHTGKSRLIIRLEYEGCVYGFLVVTVPVGMAADEEEHSLFGEVSDDIAFALHAIEVEAERVQAVEKLRESEKRYRLLAENITDIIWTVDMNLRFTYISPSVTRILGYSVEEAMSLTLEEFLPPASLEISMKAFTEKLAVEEMDQKDLSQSLTLEVEYYCKDGSTIWAEIKATGLRDSDGRLVRIQGASRDITERVQAEEELQLLFELTRVISEAPHLHSAIEPVLRRVGEVTKWDYGEAWIPDNDGSALECLPVWYSSNPKKVQKFRQVSERIIFQPNTGLPGRVWSSRQPEWIQDITAMPDEVFFRARDAIESGLRAAFGIPIITGEEVFAVLVYFISEPRQEDNRMIDLVSSVAVQLEEVMRRKRAEEQTRRQLAFLKSLHTIDRAIAASVDINLTIGVFLDQVLTQLEIDAADVLLFNPVMHTLDCAGRKGFNTSALEHTHLRLGQGLAGQVALQREIKHIPDLREEKELFLASPDLAGEEFVAYYGVPLVAKGVLKGVLEIFHRAPLSTDAEWLRFRDTLARQAAIAIDNAIMFTDLERSHLELGLAYNSTLEGWARALELRDMETEGHSRRVTKMTRHLAIAMGIGGEALSHVYRGALLHDIGKMGIPDSILHNSGPLDEQEWEIMRKHPVYARDMLAPIAYLRPAMDIPYSHHERWDGTGYPQGLRGEAIPLSARIFAIVDVWDALTSDRPYREAWPEEKVLEHIREQSGKHFDPRVVEALLAMIGK